MSLYFLCTPFSPFCPSPVADLALRVLKCRVYCYSGIVRLKEQETVCYSQSQEEGDRTPRESTRGRTRVIQEAEGARQRRGQEPFFVVSMGWKGRVSRLRTG